jgi:Replication-relaxation/Type IV secretion-system coupling protein DNA-binding domain
MTTLAPAPYPLLPTLRAANAEVLVHPEDRKYGSLLVGGQGSGKTAAMLRMYLNDVRDPHAAVIVLDPKGELSELCLRLTPPQTAKRLWYLDLGRPLFGMSPLRLIDERPMSAQATQIAGNVVAALLDISEGQIFQSSRRYLYHAVIGALALAERRGDMAMFEDVFGLLLPRRADLRAQATKACAVHPDLAHTKEFFVSVLPGELEGAGSATHQRLDPPRNKVETILTLPSLRRFFNHPTDVRLGEIVAARDILVVNANMAELEAENAKACMHFLLRMLHSQLQRHMHLAERERPRVALLVDEAHYVATSENVADQIATHRAAGLDVTFGLQYFAQLGAGSQAYEQKIRHGVINLLQNRFIFRLGDARDAEEATRIAMAVYTSAIRDDTESRARLRVTPEQVLNLPVHHCIASWIADGSRIPSFVGRTFAIPEATAAWKEIHLARLAEVVGLYPEVLPVTYKPTSRAAEDDEADSGSQAITQGPMVAAGPTASPAIAPVGDGGAPAADPDELRRVEPLIREAAEPQQVRRSRVRELVGARPASEEQLLDERSEVPQPSVSLRAAVLAERIKLVKPPETHEAAEQRPRLYDADYAVLALLDRGGLLVRELIGRAVMPDATDRAVLKRLDKLHRAGLVARHRVGAVERVGRLPYLWSLTAAGMQVAQRRQPPAIPPERRFRAIESKQAAFLAHDTHVLAWVIELHRLLGQRATDNWRTPRYATGRFAPPQVGRGRARRPITAAEVAVPKGVEMLDLELDELAEIKPDAAVEIRAGGPPLTFDVLVEYDRRGQARDNREKFLAYDAFLTGWCLEHPRYKALGSRPVVVFVCASAEVALTYAKLADRIMTGRMGTHEHTPAEWYFAGREHIFFAVEEDLHHGSLSALALPNLPPGLRGKVCASDALGLTRVELL